MDLQNATQVKIVASVSLIFHQSCFPFSRNGFVGVQIHIDDIWTLISVGRRVRDFEDVLSCVLPCGQH